MRVVQLGAAFIALAEQGIDDHNETSCLAQQALRQNACGSHASQEAYDMDVSIVTGYAEYNIPEQRDAA
jgi:hypothetical protein